MYAINVCDLERVSEIQRSFLIAPVCQRRDTVNCEPKMVAGYGVILECDDEQAQAIVDVIRIKHPRNLVRCYRRTQRGTWRKV